MQLEHIECPEDWVDATSSSSLGKGMAALEEHFRCPICSEFLNIAMTAKCGHAFCSQCIRDWVGAGADNKQCPQCRFNKNTNGALYAQDLRPCPPLDKAAREFLALRPQLLDLMSNKKEEPSSGRRSSSSGASAAFLAAGDEEQAEEDDDEEYFADESSGGGSNRGNRRGHQGGGASANHDHYWLNDDLKNITRYPNYHNIKESKLRPQLDAVRVPSGGSKEAVIFRHQTYLKLGDVERDKIKMGNPTRSRGEVVQEVLKNEQTYLGSRRPSKSSAASITAQDKSWGNMIKQARKGANGGGSGGKDATTITAAAAATAGAGAAATAGGVVKRKRRRPRKVPVAESVADVKGMGDDGETEEQAVSMMADEANPGEAVSFEALPSIEQSVAEMEESKRLSCGSPTREGKVEASAADEDSVEAQGLQQSTVARQEGEGGMRAAATAAAISGGGHGNGQLVQPRQSCYPPHLNDGLDEEVEFLGTSPPAVGSALAASTGGPFQRHHHNNDKRLATGANKWSSGSSGNNIKRPKTSAQPSLPDLSFLPKWECSACTILNQPTANRCQVCHTPRDASDGEEIPLTVVQSQKKLYEGLQQNQQHQRQQGQGDVFHTSN